MAGPVPPYLATQTAAQTAFTVPFGLLTLVNTAITTATVAGEFNTTVDCSLFTAEDVSNLRIYLDSEGYLVEFAKNSGNKSLLIDWSRFLDIPGSNVTVFQGTSPWVVSGTVGVTQSGPFSVSIVGSSSGTNLFATNDTVPFGIETTILSHTVTTPFSISQLVAWGTYDGEFLIRNNGVIVGGGRTSAADRTLNLTYTVAPIPTTSGDVVTVTILEYGPGTQQFRCNLIGE
jgi:hypothetical protein